GGGGWGTQPAGLGSAVLHPAQGPSAPGAPQIFGIGGVIAAPGPAGPPVGAPGGRSAGAPVDLSTLANTDSPPPQRALPPSTVASAGSMPMPAPQGAPASPPPQVRNVLPATPNNQQLATLPPSASQQDEYDMAYGYGLHKDYSLCDPSFRDYLKIYPYERLVPEAQYWLGESLFQQQRYRDAAESFLGVSTKFERSAKAPDALLRLGQSLAAMNQKEAACATLAEVGR